MVNYHKGYKMEILIANFFLRRGTQVIVLVLFLIMYLYTNKTSFFQNENFTFYTSLLSTFITEDVELL